MLSVVESKGFNSNCELVHFSCRSISPASHILGVRAPTHTLHLHCWSEGHGSLLFCRMNPLHPPPTPVLPLCSASAAPPQWGGHLSAEVLVCLPFRVFLCSFYMTPKVLAVLSGKNMEKCIYSISPEAEVSVLHFKATDLMCFIALRSSGEQGRCVPSLGAAAWSVHCTGL